MFDPVRSLRVEFHCHTVYSRDSLVTPVQLLAACRRRGVDRVVITDHNTIQGALIAKDIDPERVVVGEEILTTQGELLAAFVQEEIPEGLPPIEAITRLRDQGAFISVSHPFDVTRKGHWKLEELKKIAPLVDAVEVFNARCLRQEFNSKAAAFAKEHDLPGTVGSDAHTRAEYGRAVLLLPEFSDGAGLKQALSAGISQVRSSGIGVRFGSRYAVIKKSITGEI